MFYLRLAGAAAGFFAACAYGIALAALRRDRSRVARDTARMIARLARPPLGLHVRALGEEHLHAERPCVYVANHQSIFDVPVLASLYPAGTAVVAKKEIRRIPLFGWLYERTGNILIDRRDRDQAVGRLREAEAAIAERGVSVWIFPEGTRGPGTGELLPFKKGAFHLAIAAGVPLVPVVVEPLKEILNGAARRIRPATVEVRVLEPIPTRGLTDADLPALMRRTWERMAAVYHEMAAQRGLRTAGPAAPSLPAADD